MHQDKITKYRAEAKVCISRADADSNKSTSARWLKVASEWTRMADQLEQMENPPKSETPTEDGTNSIDENSPSNKRIQYGNQPPTQSDTSSRTQSFSRAASKSS